MHIYLTSCEIKNMKNQYKSILIQVNKKYYAPFLFVNDFKKRIFGAKLRPNFFNNIIYVQCLNKE